MKEFFKWMFSISKCFGANLRVVRIMGFNFVVGVRSKKKQTPQSGQRYAPEEYPIEDNKIVFLCDQNVYRCNPKYITEEIIQRRLPWNLVWIVDRKVLQNVLDKTEIFSPSVRLVMMGSDECFKECYTAKIIVDNTWRLFLLNRGIRKRPGQVYIQTWRTSYGIKKFGYARHSCSAETLRKFSLYSSQVDWFISNSKWESNFYRLSLRIPSNRILELGHPRNDILFCEEQHEKIRRKIFKKFHIPEGKKLLLYAPTRNDERPAEAYALDIPRVLEACSKKWGGDWLCATRLTAQGVKKHYLAEVENIIPVHDHADVQELLIAADVCISDYSSCIFDYIHTGRPAFICALDRRNFEQHRGIYYPLIETPFPVTENNAGLIQDILNHNQNLYFDKVRHFLEQKGSIEDGKASKRVVDFMKGVLNGTDKSKEERKSPLLSP